MKANALIVGGGMITQEVILPTVFQQRRRGKIGHILIASRRRATIDKLEKLFPDESFEGYPGKGTPAEQSCPDAYRDALRLLPKPGIVFVATPDHIHTQVILDALESGFHVIVQKPLCLKMDEADRIAETARACAGYVMTDYHKRFDLALCALQYRYRRKMMGEAICAFAWHQQRREIPLKWFRQWCQQSSPFEYLGSHYVDMFHFVTGLKPSKVIAFAQQKFLPAHGINACDAVQAIIIWQNGAVEYVQTSWILPDGNPCLSNQGFQITCTEGEFFADNADRNSNFVTTSAGYERFNPYFFKPYVDRDDPEKNEFRGYGADSIIQGIDDCLTIFEATSGKPEEEARKIRAQMIAKLEKTRPLLEEAAISVAVIEAARMSFTSGNLPVMFDEALHPKLAQ